MPAPRGGPGKRRSYPPLLHARRAAAHILASNVILYAIAISTIGRLALDEHPAGSSL